MMKMMMIRQEISDGSYLAIVTHNDKMWTEHICRDRA
jgi:hypothetical protein